jgi:hypothetical protein
MFKSSVRALFASFILFIAVTVSVTAINANGGAHTLGNPVQRYVPAGSIATITVEVENTKSSAVDNITTEVNFSGCTSSQYYTQVTCSSIEGGSCSGNKAIRNFGTLLPDETRSAKINFFIPANAPVGKEVAACTWTITGTQNGQPITILQPWNNVAVFVQVAQAQSVATAPKPTFTPTRRPTAVPSATPAASTIIPQNTTVPTTSPTSSPTDTPFPSPEPTVTTSPTDANEGTSSTTNRNLLKIVLGVFSLILILLLIGVAAFIVVKRRQR